MGSPIDGRITRPRRRPARPFTLDSGPFMGMRDSVDPAASDPLKATLLQNCYPEGASVVGRPGMTATGAFVATTQWVGQYTRLSGAEYTVAVVGGEIYTYDWGTPAWTKVVTTANLTTAGITLHNASRVSAVTFADKLVIADDGVNTPFTWDGSTGAGGLVKLTNAPAFSGPPVVYYGKLFGIKESDPRTIVWSEEADPTTGYEAGGYTNRWTLGQTDTSAVTALLATNEALYVFRERSLSAIHGAVTSDFETTGTRAGISESTGTLSPWAIAVAEGKAFFLDADAHPQVLELGGAVHPIWHDLQETCGTLRRGQWLETASAVYDPNLRLVRYSALKDDGSGDTIELCYTVTTPTAVAVFRGYNTYCVGVAKDGDGLPVVLHGYGGSIYADGTPDGDVWSDGGAAITHVVQGPYMGHDVTEDKHFHRFDATLRSGVTVTEVSVDVETPYEQGAAQTVDVATGGTWSDGVVRVGLNTQGRWIRPRVTHAVVGEQFGLSRMRVAGVTRSDEPNTL
jgi:hypothetical protein